MPDHARDKLMPKLISSYICTEALDISHLSLCWMCINEKRTGGCWVCCGAVFWPLSPACCKLIPRSLHLIWTRRGVFWVIPTSIHNTASTTHVILVFGNHFISVNLKLFVKNQYLSILSFRVFCVRLWSRNTCILVSLCPCYIMSPTMHWLRRTCTSASDLHQSRITTRGNYKTFVRLALCRRTG